MSNALAFATVTEAIRHLLVEALQVDVPDAPARVTTLRPGSWGPGKESASVNLYLHRVVSNGAFAARDLPTRDAQGRLRTRPSLALDLHYLVSFHGDDARLEPQRLLASALRAIHAQPFLPRSLLDAVVAASRRPGDPDAFLGASTLAQQPETVRLAIVPVGPEEMARLWGLFPQVPYALSAILHAGVVLLDAPLSYAAPLPVRALSPGAGPGPRPSVITVAPAEPFVAATADARLRVTGTGLAAAPQGTRVAVRVGRALLAREAVVADGASLQVDLARAAPADLRAGATALQVIALAADGTPADWASEPVLFALRPTVGMASVEPAPAPGRRRLVVEVAPHVGTDQRVLVHLNRVGGGPAYTFDPEPIAQDGPRLSFLVPDVAPGPYLLRIRVDGVESLLRADATGAYDGPVVEVGS